MEHCNWSVPDLARFREIAANLLTVYDMSLSPDVATRRARKMKSFIAAFVATCMALELHAGAGGGDGVEGRTGVDKALKGVRGAGNEGTDWGDIGSSLLSTPRDSADSMSSSKV